MSRAWPYLLLAVAAGLLLLVWRKEAERAPAAPPPGATTRALGEPLLDPEGRFELRLPAGWESRWLQTGPAQTEALSARAPGEPDVAVHVYWSRIPPVALLQLHSRAVSLASARGERVVDGRRVEEGGAQLVELETRSPRLAPHTGAALTRFVAARGQLLQVRALAPVDRFPQLRSVFAEMADSLQVR